MWQEIHIGIVDITAKDETPDKVWQQRTAKENKFINYSYVYTEIPESKLFMECLSLSSGIIIWSIFITFLSLSLASEYLKLVNHIV